MASSVIQAGSSNLTSTSASSSSRKRPYENATINANGSTSSTTIPTITTSMYTNGTTKDSSASSDNPTTSASMKLIDPIVINKTSSVAHQHLNSSENGVSSANGSSVEYMTICKPAPFSTDTDAIIERENCDYTQRITYQMARSSQTPRRVRVYADGIYDLFHQGHARQLMQAKNLFPNVYLIVGVCSDELTHSKKGRTVMNDSERYEAVRHCRYVDEIVPDAPWILTDDYIEKHKIDFVAHDDIPYVGDDSDDIYGPLKARGMFVATERTEGVSTSDIVARIVKDYDIYVRRNLARGYSAKELNVSFLSEKKFRLQNKMDELKDRGKRVMNEVKGDIITKWEEKSRELIDTFLLLFGRDRLTHIWNESKGKIMQALSPPGSPNGSEIGDADADADDDDDDDESHTPNHIYDSSPPTKRAYHKRVSDSLTDTDDEERTSH